MKSIGVLTSGGDTPGMNAAVHAVVKQGMHMGYAVMGIYGGYQGLIEGRVRPLMYADVDRIVHKGGTILRTARSEDFRTQEGFDRAMQVLRAYNLDGLIVIGGDGSFRGAKALADKGMPTIGLPGTIDNDMGYTDFTIGFDTATNNLTHEVSKIRDTMLSHDRVGVIEVMGRNCGDIALWVGISSAADLILVPECPMDWKSAAEQLVENKLRGKLTSIVIIAEGAGSASDFAKYVRDNTDVDIKAVVPGYIQRGGNPTVFDRVLATRLAARAVELIAEGKGGRAVGIRDNHIVDEDLTKAVETKDVFDQKLYELNVALSKF